MQNISILTSTLRKAYASAEKGKFSVAAGQALTVLSETSTMMGAGMSSDAVVALNGDAWGLIEVVSRFADATTYTLALANESNRSLQDLAQKSLILKSNPRR